jgi:hypothetical protein
MATSMVSENHVVSNEAREVCRFTHLHHTFLRLPRLPLRERSDKVPNMGHRRHLKQRSNSHCSAGMPPALERPVRQVARTVLSESVLHAA